jgi:putative redox protein
MDVVSYLKKFARDGAYESFEASAETEQTTEHPRVFKKVTASFKFRGIRVEEEAVRQSVELSMTKYCGVSAMVSLVVPIEYKIFVDDREIANGTAKFF